MRVEEIRLIASRVAACLGDLDALRLDSRGADVQLDLALGILNELIVKGGGEAVAHPLPTTE